MSERLIIIAPEQREVNRPIIFLAGPIQGAEDWQSRAVEIIHNANPKAVVASPRRFSFAKKFNYDEQVDWETDYLEKAGKNGVILFWLAKEAEVVPGRAYAQTSRWELATWKERHLTQGAKLVVGIEEGFSGARYIRKMLTRECPDIPLLSSLDKTCTAALALNAGK